MAARREAGRVPQPCLGLIAVTSLLSLAVGRLRVHAHIITGRS